MDLIDKDIRNLVEGGEIFDAIHLFRKRYRLGLNNAKAYIDAIKNQDLVKLKELHTTLHIEEKREEQVKGFDVDPDILNAIHDNDKTLAIKICLDRYPMDAIQAKKYIEAILSFNKEGVIEYGPRTEVEPYEGLGVGTPVSESVASLEDQEVVSLLKANEETKAIQFYKDRHQVDFEEAKEVIAQLKKRFLP